MLKYFKFTIVEKTLNTKEEGDTNEFLQTKEKSVKFINIIDACYDGV